MVEPMETGVDSMHGREHVPSFCLVRVACTHAAQKTLAVTLCLDGSITPDVCWKA